MPKLEGFSRVAVVEFGCREYHFAIYDDGTDYNAGDAVIVSGVTGVVKIKEIISAEECKERCKKNIISEVICKVDISAYEERVKRRTEKAKLEKDLEKRRKEIQKKLDDEYYASKDDAYAEMLRRYSEL